MWGLSVPAAERAIKKVSTQSTHTKKALTVFPSTLQFTTTMAVTNQRLRRRLLAGLLVGSYSCRNTTQDYSNHHLAAAVAVVVADEFSPGGDDAPQLLEHNEDNGKSRKALENERDADTVALDLQDEKLKKKQSVESVISALRKSELERQQQPLENNLDMDQHDDDHNDKYASDEINRTRRKKRRDRQRRQTRANNKSMEDSTSSSSSRNLIVGGSIAPPGRFPYAVSLQLEYLLEKTSSATYGDGADVADLATCGGTLVAMDVVLTAAHCGYEELSVPTNTDNNSSSSQQQSQGEEGQASIGQTPQQVFVGADVGAYNLTSNDGGGYTVENMLFEKLVLHPDYSGYQGVALQNDVMLVKLYGASDQPVVRLHNPHLENEEDALRAPETGEELVVIGWGDTDPDLGEEHTTIPSVIHAAAVSYVPNDVCEESKGYSVTQSYTSSEYFEYAGTITDDMMCALGQYQQDACQGDSGGGLIRLGDDFIGGEREDHAGTDVLLGHNQCFSSHFPSFYFSESCDT